MQLILTHDNADFDAVASQLGAHKLVPEAHPVLPFRLNRNVRYFLALYWDELPFWRAKDLPRERVTHLIVVDTQHYPTIRGAGKRTAVHIIDHHSPRPDLDPSWRITSEPVGATTTLLCEQIQSRKIALTPIEATLLALGIYEDTGSLTYSATTPRDIHAAGWLVASGARLDVVREFLYHPLSEDQRALYERLIENARTYTIGGYSIVVAAAPAPDLKEGLAVLAQKIRDAFDPVAVFVLADLGSHIQMVARSTASDIDVGQIAGRLGGGGHSYAAAAIIRGRTLQEAHEALLALLPEMIGSGGVTVADLMSHGVQTLSPDTRADRAAALMRRRGHEGFPIVDQGRIVGLLTRRAVDRAMDHGLVGVRAERLMQAGEVFVRPTDSIATLQRVMMTSGWGQVPVVDEDGKIIGVVTRTDLVRHLGHTGPLRESDAARREAIVRRLERALPPILMALVREIGQVAQGRGAHLYVVGGFVRDLLLDTPTIDIDFVVEGDAIGLTQELQRRFGGEMRSHARFGTGKWLIDPPTWERIAEALGRPPVEKVRAEHLPAHIDFATARAEFYEEPTALPRVESSNIKLDLHRRDFTINTLAICLDPDRFGQLLDFYEGETDLREKRIRVLHSLSFVDDPTRILRAVRLEQRLGFRIESRTEELIGHAVPLLDRVSGDRIRHEIELILEEQAPEKALCRLHELGVLKTIHPLLECDEWVARAFARLREGVGQPVWPEVAGIDLVLPYFALLTYRLPPDALEAVCARLRVRGRTVETLRGLARLRDQVETLGPDQRPSQVDAMLSGASDVVLLAAWAAVSHDEARRRIADYACHLRHITPYTGGSALKARGLKPGPLFGMILGRLRTAWLDGEISTPEQEQALLERLLVQEMI